MRVAKWLGVAAGLFLAAVVVGFGALSLAGSAQAQGPGDKSGRYEELLAQKLGVSLDKLKEAQKAARDQLIDEGVANGRITKEQAEKMKSAQPGALRDRLQMGREKLARVAHNVLEDAAQVIGIDATKVREGLRDGKSLTEIAAANGKNRDTLKTGLEKALKEDIATAEKNGTITSEQADKLEAGVTQRIDQIIDRKGGNFEGFKQGFRGGPRGQR